MYFEFGHTPTDRRCAGELSLYISPLCWRSPRHMAHNEFHHAHTSIESVVEWSEQDIFKRRPMSPPPQHTSNIGIHILLLAETGQSVIGTAQNVSKFQTRNKKKENTANMSSVAVQLQSVHWPGCGVYKYIGSLLWDRCMYRQTTGTTNTEKCANVKQKLMAATITRTITVTNAGVSECSAIVSEWAAGPQRPTIKATL